MAEFNLLRFMERAEWMADANCRGLDPETFMFVEHCQVPAGAAKLARAREICRGCDVAAECLTYALNNNEEGIWAGTTFQQRRVIRRQRAQHLSGPIPPPSELRRREHGSPAGFRQHRYYGDDPCAACRSAYAIDQSFKRPSRASVTA